MTFAIHKDLSGDIWIGVYKGGGINRLDPQTGKFKQYLLANQFMFF
jgi:streptogramin lyase